MSKPAYDLSDAEKRDLIQLIQAGKPLPDKYRFVLFVHDVMAAMTTSPCLSS